MNEQTANPDSNEEQQPTTPPPTPEQVEAELAAEASLAEQQAADSMEVDNALQIDAEMDLYSSEPDPETPPVLGVDDVSKSTIETARESAQAVASGSMTLEEAMENVLGETKEYLEELGRKAATFTGSSGQQYRISTFSEWTRRQNKEARKLWQELRVLWFKHKHVGEDGTVDAAAEGFTFRPEDLLELLTDVLLETDHWGRFFGMIYMKVNAGTVQSIWSPTDVVIDDFDDLSNEQALGAIYFFITSSIDSFPAVTQRFLKTKALIKPVSSR